MMYSLPPSILTGIFFSNLQSTSFKPVARPLASLMISIGMTSFMIFTPSTIASFTSCCAAVMFSRLNRAVRMTLAQGSLSDNFTSPCLITPLTTSSGFSVRFFSVPIRRDTETTSIEVSPPPTQTIFLPVYCISPLLNFSRNLTALTQLGVVSKSFNGNERPFQQPMAQSTASKFFSRSATGISLPMRVFILVVMPPISRMRLHSCSRRSRGRR